MSLPGAVASIAGRLASVPPEADAALVLRHAEREAIPPGTFGEDVRLTSGGVAAAEGLGSLLSIRYPSGIRSSPLSRCTDTASAIARGAGWEAGPVHDRLLGDHGPFVTDASVCGPLFLETGIRELVRRQLSDGPPPPGMRPTGEGVGLLLDMVSGGLRRNGRLQIHVTHDAILRWPSATFSGWGSMILPGPPTWTASSYGDGTGGSTSPGGVSTRVRAQSAVRRMASDAEVLAL